MADWNWRKDPRIQAARAECKRQKKAAVLVLSFGGGGIQGASYGVDRRHCEAAGYVLDSIVALLLSAAYQGSEYGINGAQGEIEMLRKSISAGD